MVEFINNLKKLSEKQNHVYLFLVVWLLIAYACMIVFNLINMPIIGIIIYYPLLGFTLFLFFISLFGKKISEFSKQKLILLLVIDAFLILIFLLIIVFILIISIFFYIFITSYFLLYGCYNTGKNIDEKLYYKKASWFWRRLEYWGGFIASLILLIIFTIITWTAATYTGVTVLILISYIALIIVIICLAIYNLIQVLFKKRLNAWLGVYFVFITGYTFYLVLKVFMGLYEGSESESAIFTTILLLFLDLFILLYSIGSILGKKGKILAEKVKFFSIDSALLWLIFCKASWEFASNFPYGTFGLVQAFGIQNVEELGAIINLVANTTILAVFYFLVVIFGFFGIYKYGKEKERLKTGKEEITEVRKSGERRDDDIKEDRKVLLQQKDSEDDE